MINLFVSFYQYLKSRAIRNVYMYYLLLGRKKENHWLSDVKKKNFHSLVRKRETEKCKNTITRYKDKLTKHGKYVTGAK